MAQTREGTVIFQNGSQTVRQATHIQLARQNTLSMTGIVESSPDVFDPGETLGFVWDGGFATGGAATTLIDTTKNWTTNEWQA